MRSILDVWQAHLFSYARNTATGITSYLSHQSVKLKAGSLLCLTLLLLSACQTDQPSGVELDFIEDMSSEYVRDRNISIWLPPSYAESDQSYPVLYMHDGQNVFDPSTSYIGEEWGVDEAVTRLSSAGEIPEIIVVGVWNTDIRWQEYMPEKIFNALPESMQKEGIKHSGRPVSDDYLRFLVQELKPYIDQKYRTKTEPEHTGIMGSSMGGLISFYAATEYPQVFGLSAAVSTHWPVNRPAEEEAAKQQQLADVSQVYRTYLEQTLNAAQNSRFYFDHGSEHVDAHYAPYQAIIDEIMEAHGFQPEINLHSQAFPGATHNEIAWRERIDIPLRFLFGPASAASEQLAEAKRNRPIEDEVIYFVMPDRFADGDPSNNHGGFSGGPDDHGYDPTHKGYFHGGDIKGLIEHLDYLQGMGITAIWFTPIFKNKPVQGDPPNRSAGYHGYWITDFTQIDPHLGTNEDFRAFVDAAHGRGMKVIMDIVTNHTADVIQYRECVPDPDNTTKPAELTEADYKYRSLEEYPYQNRCGVGGAAINQGFQGDGPEHQTEENFAQLTDLGYAFTPHIPESERHIKVPYWLNDPRYYHNRGNSHWEGESALYGDFAGLDDIFTEHPRVVEGMIDIFKTWISDFRIDGFRVDTAKHVNDEFWQQFVPAIQAHAKAEGINDFYIFGEVYGFDPEFLGRYTTDAKFPAVLDFAFQRTAQRVIAEDKAPVLLKELFDKDHHYQGDPRGANILPTFLGNHDMGRIGHFLQMHQGNIASDEDLLNRAKLAYTLLFFSRGIPVIYYGDEQGFTGHGNDQLARQDMFPSHVDVYNDNRLIGTQATTAVDNFDTQHPLYQHIAVLAKTRQGEAGLRRGQQKVLQADDKPGIYAFTRQETDSDIKYLIVLNTSDNDQEASLELDEVSGGLQTLLQSQNVSAATLNQSQLEVKLGSFGYAVYRFQIDI